jgi:hypothetical protein
MKSADTGDHAAAVEWLETVYYAERRKAPHVNQHGFFSIRIDQANEHVLSSDAAVWPQQDGFRRLGLLNPCPKWFREFFYRGWSDDVETPASTPVPDISRAA